jgi:hypothetical protein
MTVFGGVAGSYFVGVCIAAVYVIVMHWLVSDKRKW